jgi:hypothetical protein
MESHDEERLNFRNKEYGKVSASYSSKHAGTSLERIKAASVLFYTIPGPKMLWQFGELGYDYSINTCEDGTVADNCRVSPKPVKWEYIDEINRHNLSVHTADLINLHTNYSVFTVGQATIVKDSLINDVQIKNVPYTANPVSADEMNAQAVANLHLTEKTVTINFPHTGIWYDYYTGGLPINVTAVPYRMKLSAGGYKLFTDVPIGRGPVTDVEEDRSTSFHIYPNPTNGRFRLGPLEPSQIKLFDLRGSELRFVQEGEEFDISLLPTGLYILQTVNANGKKATSKIIKY